MSGIRAVLDRIRPGNRVFVAGSGGEPSALLAAWNADPDRTRDLHIVTSAVPGINGLDLESLHPTARVTGLFMQPAFANAQRAGRYRHLPVSYAGFARMLAEDLTFDVCVAQVAPAEKGRCSMGPAVEFLPLALRRSREVVGLANAGTPVLSASKSVAADDFVAIAEVDTPLPTYDTGAIDDASRRVAEHIAPFIPDGATLQVGLGKTPAALMQALTRRRGLRLHGGMFGDGVVELVRAGALDTDWPHRACVFVGQPELYRWAGQQNRLGLAGCEITHGAETLAGLTAFFAVNSAVEVDLWGQAALEHAGGAAISGAGGAPDFARAARMSPHGASMVALPATAARGTRSRIVPALSAPGVATLPRTDIDIVVTEFGAADLRGCSVVEKGGALASIAAPQFREELEASWHKMLERL
ncbi:acetyl-CoA hydrolase/transferase family protein [Xanthobacter oligotrophicus]|uniref:acetyl-CoA hydrolase/transferase family protein n=1 Tax=Xanthobacter oligotrophicus TaxID=2607286 RepID=UPI0011F22BA4|nr:acetyl-CoA hydrolase/transferase C-terminal domain-containing protein [Xanthobacter oligotrophicus]MCG5236596.1 hypothetical protein [Xanthobacter oligotrophicus]